MRLVLQSGHSAGGRKDVSDDEFSLRRLLVRAFAPTGDAVRQAGPGKKINLALQGGGAHGAFTWGVLDQLLDDGRLVIDGLSGTSAGALNAVVTVDGLARGGPEAARARLAEFWRAVSLGGTLPDLQRQVVERLFSVMPFGHSPMRAWLDSMARYLSPYDLNPLNINPLKQLIEGFVDFGALRADAQRDLFVSATNVRTGRLRVFRREEITPEVVMASACLPFLFRAVEIDGVPYWDGGYVGNPVLSPFLQATHTEDVLIVQINPLERRHIPVLAREIMNRTNEITFNASLQAELRHVEFVTRMVDEGKLPRGTGPGEYRRLRLHRIVLDELEHRYDSGSKLKTDYEFFELLHKMGQRAARRFLDAHFADIGVRSSMDVADEMKAAVA
jgi:NTE family protein